MQKKRRLPVVIAFTVAVVTIAVSVITVFHTTCSNCRKFENFQILINTLYAILIFL